MNKKEGIISALISIVLGLLLIILKGDVIGIAITVLGAAVIVMAVIDFVNRLINMGIIKAVAGVFIIVFGWLFINLALYILAAAIIAMGLLRMVNIHRFCPANLSLGHKLLLYIKPAVMIIAGACLLFNQGGTIAWVFIVTGVLLITEGALEIVGIIKDR